MSRNEDYVLLTGRHLRLRDRLKVGPAFDFELTREFGEDYADLLRDLRTNEYPVHSVPARSEDRSNSRIHFYEKAGSELTLCMWCKRRTRETGLFCSGDCQLDWEVERFAEIEASRGEDGTISSRRELNDLGVGNNAGASLDHPDLYRPWKSLRRRRKTGNRAHWWERRPVILTRYLVTPLVRRKKRRE